MKERTEDVREGLRMPRLTSAEFAALTGQKAPKRHKYGVSAPEARTYNGKVYASKAEAVCAANMDLLIRIGEVREVVEQPRLWLGIREEVYVPDFLVIVMNGPLGHAYYVDVKGHETARFKHVKRLWRNYGRLPLHIVRRGKTVEVIEAAGCRGRRLQEDR